jgi:putative SOS response-associated peptidase YedK
MCGRYITARAAAFEKAIRLGKISWQFEPSYNIGPTQSVPAVRPSQDGPEGLTRNCCHVAGLPFDTF